MICNGRASWADASDLRCVNVSCVCLFVNTRDQRHTAGSELTVVTWRTGRLLAPNIGVLISSTSCNASPRCACLQRLLYKYMKFILESYNNIMMHNARIDCQPLGACCEICGERQAQQGTAVLPLVETGNPIWLGRNARERHLQNNTMEIIRLLPGFFP
jgi:hypothetical protein